jgi:hypothetical protein
MTTLNVILALYLLLIVGGLLAPSGLKEWVYQVWIAIDQTLNAIHGGYADETMSARCGRLGGRWPYRLYRPVIDALFYPFQGPNHCVNAYAKERQGRHLPPEYRGAVSRDQ